MNVRSQAPLGVAEAEPSVPHTDPDPDSVSMLSSTSRHESGKLFGWTSTHSGSMFACLDHSGSSITCHVTETDQQASLISELVKPITFAGTGYSCIRGQLAIL